MCKIFQIVMERANFVKAISNVDELEKKIGAGQVTPFSRTWRILG